MAGVGATGGVKFGAGGADRLGISHTKSVVFKLKKDRLFSVTPRSVTWNLQDKAKSPPYDFTLQTHAAFRRLICLQAEGSQPSSSRRAKRPKLPGDVPCVIFE
jgi:hypothetical protein